MEGLGVIETVEAIRKVVTQTAASKKDETRVMMAMLNDKSYEVNVYDSNQQVGTFSPAKAARDMASSIIANTTQIGKDEAANLADGHEFTRSEAENMIGISKEFIYTYIQTKRKLPLGTRDNIDVGLSLKEVKSRKTAVPHCIGKDAEGKDIYEFPVVNTKPYTSIKVHASCPSHLK